VLAVTGGGSSAVSELMSQPGASKTVLEAIIPYSSASLEDFLGAKPAQSCSAETARRMAMASYLRAIRLNPEGKVFGLGCTAAITTDRQRRGLDRCYVAVQSTTSTTEISLTFNKDDDREKQERGCRQLILEAMARATELIEDFKLENVSHRTGHAESLWRELNAGEIRSTWRRDKQPTVLFPGAFNPFHAGHQQILKVAEKITGSTVVMEVSIINVDKPRLDFIDMQQRISGVSEFPLIFTHAPTFVEKSHLFPGSIFVVGADTISRIADTRYYSDSTELRNNAIDLLINNKHRFLVFGRLIDDQYITLSETSIPQRLLQICDEVPEADFRHDLSSSELREKSGQDDSVRE